MKQTFWLSRPDGVSLFVNKWYNQGTQPRAIVQIAHGMAEHSDRYEAFATFLLEHNIFVYANDHRGHGRTGERQGLLGYFADHDGFTKTAYDLKAVTSRIKKDHPDTPIFLIGHSMGSFLVRALIQDNSNLYDGVALLGTRYQAPAVSASAKAIARPLPPKKPSRLLNKLSFGTFNRKIKRPKTTFDWLTRDDDQVAQYIADPYCGFIPTARFFYDLMDGLIQIHDLEKQASVRRDLPLFILSGEADPVGDYGKGVFKVARAYHALGLTEVKTMLFRDARHELLHELNKKEVYSVLMQWLNEQLRA